MATELLRARDSATTAVRDLSTWALVSSLSLVDDVPTINGDEPAIFRLPALDDMIATTAGESLEMTTRADCSDLELFSEDASMSPPLSPLQEADVSMTNVQRRGAKKRWYAIQKDKKSALERELQQLRAQKAQYEDSAPHRMVALLLQQQKNEELRQAILEQQLRVSRATSAIASFSMAHRPPFEKYIHLPFDSVSRVATLVSMKDRVLLDAERYVTERKRFLGSTVKYAHAEKFELPNGDHCYSGFDSVPLDGVSSVRQAFDAIRRYYFNMEITYTELSGELMVRESDFDDSGDNGVTTHRFVRSTSSGTQIEANSVLFSAFRTASSPYERHRDGSVGDSAVVSVDFVNVDERFPYRPTQRVRQDTTAVITVAAYPRSKRSTSGGGADGVETSNGSEDGSVIMFTRSYFAHLHRSPELGLPSDAVAGIGFVSDFCLAALLQSMYDITTSATPVPS